MYSSSSKTDPAHTPGIAKNANEILNDVADRMHDTIDSTTRKVTRATNVANRQIHENPVRSALIALGVGYVMGRIL